MSVFNQSYRRWESSVKKQQVYSTNPAQQEGLENQATMAGGGQKSSSWRIITKLGMIRRVNVISPIAG